MLQQWVGPDVTLVEPGAAVARQTRSRLAEKPQAPGSGRIELIGTGAVDGLQAAAQRWLQPELLAQSVHLP